MHKHTTTILRIDSTSIELARVIARASTTIPMRFWSADPESVALDVAVTSIDTGEEGSGQGEGDERADFFPAFLPGFEAGSSSALISSTESVEMVSSLDFLGARLSASPIDRRFVDVLVGLQVASTSVRSDSGVDCLVSFSRIGDEERHVKGEETREGDSESDLDGDLDTDRFGVRGIDKADPVMTGDVGTAPGTVGMGSSSQVSGMSVWSEDMSSSRSFSELIAGRVEIGEAAALVTSS